MKQTDIYTEALTCLRSILLADHPEFQNWIDWLEQDIEDWTQRREVAGSNPFGPTIFCNKRSTVSRVSRWSVY